MTRRVQFTEFGTPEKLQIVETEEPHAGHGEVRVRVRYAGLNPFDLTLLASGKDFGLSELPAGNGQDFAGVVDEVGHGVEGVAEGDLVFGGVFAKAQSEELVVKADEVHSVPAGLGLDVAGGLNITGNTAISGTRVLGLKPGETVYVSGATGGVGLLAVQLAQLLGARVIGTASERNFGLLRSLGVEPVQYGDGVEQRLRAVAPNGIQAAFSTQGDDDIELLDRLGVPGARINAIAAWGEPANRLGVHHEGSGSGRPEDLDWLAQAIAYGHVFYPVDRVFALDEIHDAYAHLTDGHPVGKVLVRVASDPLTDDEKATLAA